MTRIKQPQRLVDKTAIATAIALLTAPVMAQMQLEEVVVTAQKREQTLQDVPGSVSAFSEEMLSKSNTRNFGDLGQITSGMTITPSPDGFSSIIKIRGVGNNAFAPAIRPAVGIFLDDIPLGSPEAAYSNMADIIRVEVLKGPQSTLFGKEVSAGAISLYTKRPDTQTTDAYVEGNFGNLGLQEFRVGGNLPLGDNFALRASIYNNQRDANVKNIATKNDGAPGTQDASGGPATDGGKVDATGYRVKLLWDVSERFSATLGYEDHDIAVEGTNSVAAEYGDFQHTWEQNIAGVTDPADSQLFILDPYDPESGHRQFYPGTAVQLRGRQLVLYHRWVLRRDRPDQHCTYQFPAGHFRHGSGLCTHLV